MRKYEKFQPINVSSKFGICGVPIRMDTYKTCSFGCKYCFSNCRMGIMEFEKTLKIANLNWLEEKLYQVYIKKDFDNHDLLSRLMYNRYTYHCGGMSDPFQPIEKRLNITKQAVDITNKYGIKILFSTKTDSVYNVNINPNLHTFQLSISNVDNRKDIEPNVPNIENRLKLFKDLKKNGFKVGIRIQPFIPNISNIKILEMFKEADHFVLEGLKMVPTNKKQQRQLLKITNLNINDFTNMGLYNLKPGLREKMYVPFIKWFKEHNSSYSLADNDFHQYGNNFCCCGDSLVSNYTSFNNITMLHTYENWDYTLKDCLNECKLSNVLKCNCSYLFTSNRRPSGNGYVENYYKDRFDSSRAPISQEFLYDSKIIENLEC